ncbi:MAG: hypothetical protein Q4E21_07815 [Clostridia bacterium]|nr:hypothetical protein [Clostridia bacterium]
MSGILKNLYYGNLAPADRAYAPTNAAKALRQDVQKQNDIAEQLAQCADERVRALFETYCELQAKISSAEQEDLFIYAFRLGAQWCGEVFLPRTDTCTQEDF